MKDKLTHCLIKDKFPDWKTAQKSIKGIKGEPVILNPYRCRFCAYWHVGHTTKGRHD